ncbi:MAG: hypothetical protein MO852_06915 [Candidatus Devosia euplotis]|nr:hypothetical protein [Candidatus Devosia euplotis]
MAGTTNNRGKPAQPEGHKTGDQPDQGEYHDHQPHHEQIDQEGKRVTR